MSSTHAPKKHVSFRRRESTEGRVRTSLQTTSTAFLATIVDELKAHAPFTIVGAVTGVALTVVLASSVVPRSLSVGLFMGLHPVHVFLSALVTTGMYRSHSAGRFWATTLIGYFGSVGIATLSDCVIPYLGECLLGLPNKGIHLGFIESWWLVNPLAVAGIAVAYRWPATKFPHAGHVLLSTWASVSHMTMAIGNTLSYAAMAVIFIFLFLAVWLPCCTSDILFPLLFSRESNDNEGPI